jgi:hypothetical protein
MIVAIVPTRDWRTMLGWVALAFAVLELLTAFFIEAPVAVIVFAALFVIGWLLRTDVARVGSSVRRYYDLPVRPASTAA